MKFDSEQEFCLSATDHKANTKSLDYHDNALDSPPKSTNGNMKENQSESFCDSKSNEVNANQLALVTNKGDDWDEPELHCSRNLEDLTSDEKKVRDFIAPYSHSSQKKESSDDSVFYMDKSVMECELPELIVCYKESTYHVVKDICVDEGVPLQDKFLFESDKDEKCGNKTDQHSEIMKDEVDIDIADIVKFTAENDSGKDIDDQCDFKDLMLPREANNVTTDGIVNGGSKEMVSLGMLLAMEDSGPDAHLESLCGTSSEVELQSNQGSGQKTTLAATASGSAVTESYNCSEEANLTSAVPVSTAGKTSNDREEAILASPTLPSTSEEPTISCHVSPLPYNSKVETGSITFDFDSSEPTSTRIEDCPKRTGNECSEDKSKPVIEDTGSQPDSGRFQLWGESREDCSKSTDNKCLEDKSKPVIEDAGSRPDSGRFQLGHGESSFSATGPLSGLIGNSGPIPFSGSLSHRSDSSTTSTRSFAFPILQSEWNSSPVRMAKADRRLLRKHKGWKQGLLCCRF